MDYQLESLDPWRFQELCQSLLAKEFSNVQCFPIVQPDGGRDAVAYLTSEKTSKDFIVFQIKKVQDQPDPHKWLREIIEGEAPKVAKLIPKGAKAFYLLTNVRGTAHPDSGSIDKVNKILSDAIDIPSFCWWRDDLNRRLDSAWDLKWAYPEIMTGLDMLRYILESGLPKEKHRLSSVIKTFIQGQYSRDEVVRFKQGGLLQSKLISLFIDVPVEAKNIQEEHRPRFLYMLYNLLRQHSETNELGTFNIATSLTDTRPLFSHGLSKEEQQSIGAASMLLHPLVQEKIPQIVLEGAPGQGKSTIVQYVCQIHRMRILRQNLDATTPGEKLVSVRIPIKIDLRDYATWLNGQNPFSSEEDKEKPEGWFKSLEAFLSAQIRYDSGGANFFVDDLHEVAKFSSLLLVLDGFDEVAEIAKRLEIVTEVTACVKRLGTIAASLQVIVTSRPAAFANSPGFPEKEFPHFELVSLTVQQINNYATKWVRAQGLNSRDGADIKRILKEKLNQPHLRDLARNPMQLAILLTLIHLRGPSLPDQRTALYDSYVERFFDREADKNLVVRENRNLLINIHSYLAWILHSEAEQGHDRGSVSSERLKRLLSDFLSKEELDISLAEKLSISTVERIFFLVSRVQGTFEFEVQPLREYFAARYLYKTAPLPPPGTIRAGTILDRFEAISMNFYWLNVTRFYAGFYNQGELPSLVYQLQDLSQKEGYRYIGHPKVLAAMLLMDSVFAQHKRAMKDVLALVIDRLGLRYFSTFQTPGSSNLVLPKDSGRDELVKYCLAFLRENQKQDYNLLMFELLRANTTSEELNELWYREASKAVGVERTKWLQYGVNLGSLAQLGYDETESLFSDDPYNLERVIALFRSQQLSNNGRYEKYNTLLINAILDRQLTISSIIMPRSVTELFGQKMNLSDYALALHSLEPLPLCNLLKQKYHRPNTPRELLEYNFPSENERKCIELIKIIESAQQRTAKEWASELTPWEIIVEKNRSLWDEHWLLYTIANLASGIKSSQETCKDFPDLLDHSKSLCRRARYARLRAGAPDWWKKQIEVANTEIEKIFTLLVLLTWGSSKTIINLSEIINNELHFISIDNWMRLTRSLKQMNVLLQREGSFVEARDIGISLNITKLPPNLNARTATALGIRAKLEDQILLYQKYLLSYQGSDSSILDFCQKIILELTKTDPDYWQKALIVIANSYANGNLFDRHQIQPREGNTPGIPLNIAEEIAQHPDFYPRNLLLSIEAIFREIVGSKVVPVGNIALTQHWFEE